MADLRTGQRVFLRSAPHNVGTVSHAGADGFTVVYDTPQRKPRQPRSRFSYAWPMARRFAVGHPAGD